MQLLFFIALIVLCYGLFRPEPPMKLFKDSDKVLHLVAFLGVSFLGRIALPRANPIIYWASWLILAGLLEYLQGEWQPHRRFSILDAYANAAGVLASFVISLILRQLVIRHRKTS